MYRTYTVDIVEGRRVVISHENMHVETYNGPFVGTAIGLDIALNFIYEQHRRYLVSLVGVSSLNGDRFYVTTLPLPAGEAAGADPSDPGTATTIQRG